MSEYVYVINNQVINNQAYPGWVKVGYTADLAQRLSQLNMGAPHKDYVVRSFLRVEDGRKVERLAHAVLSLTAAQSGEWFECEVEEAVTAIEEAATLAT